MGKAFRKPRPSMPHWFWYGQDGCWFCDNKSNCNQCKACRSFAKEAFIPKVKGRHSGKKTTRRSYERSDIDGERLCS